MLPITPTEPDKTKLSLATDRRNHIVSIIVFNEHSTLTKLLKHH